MGYTTITCSDCHSDLGYDNPMSTVFQDDKGVWRYFHVPGNPEVKAEPEIKDCKYCGSKDLHTQYDHDD